MTNQKETKDQSDKKGIFQSDVDYVEALEQSLPDGASEEFGPDIGIPSNYEANQSGTKVSLSGFEVSKHIGRL
ncbi:hypothetical protein [Brevibacillus brevis]|uniref:hypothetical protein n=1 Tax=Brevibacillus brevis TaxID=1393 RepID=UPI001C8EE82C|nr:hypothetical protein [Brevibacillus brevis]MBY0087729.1 hypothetical protein [Brevibacillus brevis]UKK98953.1 hypothetical protein FO446_16665 [Brevibacillus brevis]